MRVSYNGLFESINKSYIFQFHSQDIPASENTDHYMFQNLEPNKNYSINVSMRNSIGKGPAAVIYISTTPEPEST